MRRQDREINSAEINSIMESGLYGVLSTTGENGYAYGVPVSFAYSSGKIYFHCAPEGSKLDNIKHNNLVSFCVVGNIEPLPKNFSMRYESVVAFGNASEVLGDEKREALNELIEKYSPEYIEEGTAYINRAQEKTKVMKIEIDHITGKASN
jgi:nitroimidazol reductase NimA-like FMN-containing flavoprotein (pyridoxamine 5'-phosphate oxidase superfamily)